MFTTVSLNAEDNGQTICERDRMINEEEEEEEDTADIEQIQVRFPCVKSDEDLLEVQNEAVRFMTKLRSRCPVILIAVLIVTLGSVAGVLVTQNNRYLSVTVELQHYAEVAVKNLTKQLQSQDTQLKQLTQSMNRNLTRLKKANNKLKVLMNATLYNLTLLSGENTKLGVFLKDVLHEKTQLQSANKELNSLLNITYSLVDDLRKQVNESMHVISLMSAENKQQLQQLVKGQQTITKLIVENQKQHSILFSNNLAFLWRLCDRKTLQCVRCMTGWVEHASRCFLLSDKAENWEDARHTCQKMGGDLAVVLTADDQLFLTNLTYKFVQDHPQVNFHSAWIGLQDMVKEGTHLWVNGNKITPDLSYWRPNEPNNAIAYWDEDKAGQDCVAIVPPDVVGGDGWLNSWDDIVCSGRRHYICETTALILT